MVRQPIVPEFTGEEFLRWESARPEKYELHYGFVVSFAGGTLRHNAIALAMRDIFKNKLSSCATFALDVKTRIEDNAYYYPDVVVVCGEVDVDTDVIEAPTIVAEVLSPSTQAYDRIDKRNAYRKLPSLRALVIVHTETRRIEVDDRGGIGGAWRTTCYDDEMHAYVDSIVFPLDEIYGPMPTA